MAFSLTRFLKGLLISQEETQTPTEIAILPGGDPDTRTTLVSTQTSDIIVNLPDVTIEDTLVTRNNIETLTNKTLTAPIINNPDINMGTIDGAAINNSPIGALTPSTGAFTDLTATTLEIAGDPVVTEAATQTLSNKSLVDATTAIVDMMDPTIQVKIDATGSPMTSTTIRSNQTMNRILDLPDLTDTLVSRTSTDTLTNKTLEFPFFIDPTTNVIIYDGNPMTPANPAVGFYKLYFKDDGSLYYLNSAGIETQVGAAGGGALITNGYQEELLGISNGINRTFGPLTFTPVSLASVAVYVNGRFVLNDEYTITMGNVVFNMGSPAIPQPGQIVEVFYLYLIEEGTIVPPFPALAVDPPPAVAATSQVGMSTASARADHTHQGVTSLAKADMTPIPLYGDVTLSEGENILLTQVGNNIEIASTATGGGGINLIENGNAEEPLSPFISRSYPALSRPSGVGTNGVTLLTSTITSMNPLAEDFSFLITHPASNTQGQAQVIPFIVDPAYKAKVLTISADYIVTSGTFVAGTSTIDSDLIVYISYIDPLDSLEKYIEPSSFKFLSNNTAISDKFQASFQTHPTAVNYRLILYSATSSTAAYSLTIDNIAVSPSDYVFGTPVTDWAPVTVTGSFTTNTTYTARSRRVGDKKEYVVSLSFVGAPNATTLSVNLPAGDIIDTSKQRSATIGTCILNDAGIVSYDGSVAFNNTTSVEPFANVVNGVYAQLTAVSNVIPFTIGNGDRIDLTFSVAIVGLSSSVQTSDQTDTRVVAANFNQNAILSVPSNVDTRITSWSPAVTDTHGAFNQAAGSYRIPVSGNYNINFRYMAYLPLAGSGNATHRAVLYKNGIIQSITTEVTALNTHNQQLATIVSGYEQLSFVAGDVLTFYAFQNAGVTRQLSTTNINIERISGPSAIAANESCGFSAQTSVAQAVPSNVVTPITTYNVINYNSHNAFNSTTGIFTAPISGVYQISASFLTNGQTLGTGQIWEVEIVNELNAILYRHRIYGNGTLANWNVQANTNLRLLQGQQIRAAVLFQGPATALAADITFNSFSAQRIGN